MTQDADPDELIPVPDLPDVLPRRRGRKTHTATVYRWMTIGCKGIKLKFVHVCRTRCVRRADLDEFFARLTAVAAGEAAPAGMRTTAARRRAIAQADRTLDALGV